MYIIICIFFKSSAVPKLILFLSQIQLEMILLLLTGQTDTSTRGYQFHFPTSVSSLSVPFVYICFSETDIYVIETKKKFWESGATVKILRLDSKRKRKFSSLIRSTGKPFQSRENNKIISHLESDLRFAGKLHSYAKTLHLLVPDYTEKCYQCVGKK